MRMLKTLGLLAVALLSATAASAAVSLPTASISDVAISPNPTCASSNPSGQLTVSANLSGTFDSDSTSPTNYGRCVTLRSGGTILGYSRTDTVTYTTVSNKLFTVSGPDGVPQTIDASTGSATYTSGSFASGPDGQDSVSVSVVASEDVTTRTDTTVTIWPASAGGCGVGTPTSSDTTPGTPTTVAKTSSTVTGGATYLADMNPPAPVIKNYDTSNAIQGGALLVHVMTADGSPLQDYTVNVTLTSEVDGSTLTATKTDSFRGLEGTKEPSETNDLMWVAIPCTATLGAYDVSVVLSTTDICGNSWGDISAVPDPHSNPGTVVNIGPGLTLADTTFVIADYGVGGYGLEKCFTATSSNGKINTYAGSNHIATLITTEGPCIGLATLSNITIIQDIPLGFAPFVSSTRPLVGTHVFYPAGSDLHYPGPEVTLKKADVSYKQDQSDGHWRVTITLSGPFAAGDPVTNKPYGIYARTHVAQVLTLVPPDFTVYTFGTSATANGGSLYNASTYDITKDSGCVQ